jgi:hypothetical protein
MQNIVFAVMLNEVWSFLSWELVRVIRDVLYILVGRYETFAISILNSIKHGDCSNMAVSRLPVLV